jgi:hypothetical protein
VLASDEIVFGFDSLTFQLGLILISTFITRMVGPNVSFF